VIHWWHLVQHWLAVHTGTVNESGPYYGFWSGFGSDLGEVAIVGGLVHMARQHTCHEPGCWRIGHFADASGTFKLCGRHHPDIEGKLTHRHIRRAHEEAK